MPTLVEAYSNGLAALRDYAERSATQAWDSLDAYNEADVDPFITRATPPVEAAQRTAVALTDAYLARYTGVPAAGVIFDPAVRGIPTAEVYRRPFVETWTALKAGTSWREAVDHGRARVANTARTDVQLASRNTARDVLNAQTEITTYRRVLSGVESCPLCVLASTQRYWRGDLMPIHPGCDCTVEPVLGDPGHVPDRDLLRSTRRNVPDIDEQIARFKKERVRIATKPHGEYGPTLVNADHDFTQL